MFFILRFKKILPGVFLGILALATIACAELKMRPCVRIGYLSFRTMTTYGVSYVPSITNGADCSYFTHGFDVEGGLHSKWFSVNGLASYATRASFPEAEYPYGDIPPGHPSFSGGGVSLYLERLKVPFKSSPFLLRFAPGILLGYWVDKRNSFDTTRKNYVEVETARYLSGVLRIDLGYKFVASYFKIGGYNGLTNQILGIGISVFL